MSATALCSAWAKLCDHYIDANEP